MRAEPPGVPRARDGWHNSGLPHFSTGKRSARQRLRQRIGLRHFSLGGSIMSGNTLGTLFTVTTFGESHGPAIGCVIDGCPPGMSLTEADIQAELDRRKPGTSRHVTQRQEADRSRSCRACSKA
jgi:hypothetical protein